MPVSVPRRVVRLTAATTSSLLLLILPAAPGHAAGAGTGTIAGRVLDAGRPVAGATVGAFPGWNPSDPAPVTTDAAGRFRLEGVQPGGLSIEIRFPGGGLVQYYPDQASPDGAQQVPVVAGRTTTITQHALPHGAMAGRITSNRGAPVTAVVGLDDGNPRHPMRATTGADGRYFLDFLPAGTYSAYLNRRPGGSPTQWVPRKTQKYDGTPVTIKVGSVLGLSERLLPLGSITGTFTGAGGPVEADISPDGDRAASDRSSTTDGSYRLWMLTGDHKLSFEPLDGARGQWATQAATEADAEVFRVGEDAVIHHDEKAIPTGTIAGRLVDYAGRALGGFTFVQVADQDSTWSTPVYPDGEGRWSAEVQAGTYIVQLYHDYEQLPTPDPVTVRAGQTTTLADEVFAGTADLSVSATVDGSPITEFCAHASLDSREFTDCTQDGTVELTGLAPGSYQVTVDVEGHDSATVDDVPLTAARVNTVTVPVT